MAEDDPRRQHLERTLNLWQPRTCRALDREDARQITENVAGFLRVLLEWEEAKRASMPSASSRDNVLQPWVGKVILFAPVACIR